MIDKDKVDKQESYVFDGDWAAMQSEFERRVAELGLTPLQRYSFSMPVVMSPETEKAVRSNSPLPIAE